MSVAEHAVLKIFREYEMSPHQMLCFSGQDRVTHGETLLQLVQRKMLVAETFQGAYSLTNHGYAAMQVMSSDRDITAASKT